MKVILGTDFIKRMKTSGQAVFIILLILSSAAYFLTISGNVETRTVFVEKQISKNIAEVDFNENPDSFMQTNEDSVNLACLFPHVNPFDPNIMKISGLEEETIDCAEFPPDLTYLHDNKLKVNYTLVTLRYGDNTFTHCKYQNLYKVYGNDYSVFEGIWSEPFTESIDLSKDTEFIRVFCLDRESRIISRTYLALIPKKEFLDELQTVRLKKRMIEYSPVETLNVVMVGIDSLSRHHLIRAMNKTYTYLMTNFASFDLTMHTQVGANTFANALPLLTGQSEAEITKWWDSTKYMDSFELIFRVFRAAGYRTFNTEDDPTSALFHYQKRGFQHGISMYSSRPIALAMASDKELWRLNSQCAGSRAEIEFHLDYLSRFLQMFPDTPLFALTFLTNLCHDRLLNAKRGDEYFYNFLKNVHDKGLLNNTLLIFFSDHGPRWGEIRKTFNGMIESRNPFTIFSFPKWFVKKYKNLARNLRINTKRLTTHFDTHATLLDLIYFESKIKPHSVRSIHGISLFQRITEKRTCEDIPIAAELCLCARKGVQQENTNTTLARL